MTRDPCTHLSHASGEELLLMAVLGSPHRREAINRELDLRALLGRRRPVASRRKRRVTRLARVA